MDIAFILDALPLLKPYKDSSIAMMRALQQRGHRIFALQQHDLHWSQGKVGCRAIPLTVSAGNDAWYVSDAVIERGLREFDAVIMRKDPPFDMEYLYTTYLLELAEREGAPVFNRPGAIRDHNEKLAIAQFGAFTAPTLVTRSEVLIRDFIAAHGDIILKPLDGMGGTSVFRIRSGDANLNVIIETLTAYGARTVMAQRYIPEIVQGDKRILLIAGEPIPYALARIPKPGETRGNLAAGGRGVAQPLSPRDREIAHSLGPGLWAKGLLVVGLDVIGDYLTEVNVTSPTCFVEITEQTNCNVSAVFADALEAALRARRQP